MEKELQIFSFEGNNIHTTIKDGEVWFVAKDITDVLGYKNTSQSLKNNVDDIDRNTIRFAEGIKGNPNKSIINESGFYSLVLSSKLDKAKEFKHWVTSEVIPSIRKHGAYMTDAKAEQVVNNPKKGLADLLIQAGEQLKAKQATIDSQSKEISVLKPDANYTREVLQSSEKLYNTTQIGKELHMSPAELNQFLHAYGIIYKTNGQWVLYEQVKKMSAAKGKILTKSITSMSADTPYTYTKWTECGRKFIHGFYRSVLNKVAENATVSLN